MSEAVARWQGGDKGEQVAGTCGGGAISGAMVAVSVRR
jgi:hypothetical protein